MRKLFCHEEILRRMNLEAFLNWANRNHTMVKMEVLFSIFQSMYHFSSSTLPLGSNI